ncbi:MAG TPA: hypothetical protein PKE63_02550 [Lacibacter sp.]|nr:hypothetical protein [Lacibacter sp.]HMO89929.1 hypothetical protein [Lacibacter sp.]HMP86126.1 hypothetical protein [Lacibacter sp.]
MNDCTRDGDPACSKSELPAFLLAYPQLEKLSREKKNLLFWGNMLQQAPLVPFIDGAHYSPAFNRQLADSLYRWLRPRLDQRSGNKKR